MTSDQSMKIFDIRKEAKDCATEIANLRIKALETAEIVSEKKQQIPEIDIIRQEVKARMRTRISPFLHFNETEPMLNGSMRLAALPVQHVATHENYKAHRSAFWTEDEIDYTPKDRSDWDSMNKDMRRSTTTTLQFFHIGDGIVAENMSETFCREVTCRDALTYYNFQITMEDIHNATYSDASHNYIGGQLVDDGDGIKPVHLLQESSILRQDAIRQKVAWGQQYGDAETACFAERKLAWAAGELIHFRSSFGYIKYLRSLGILPALSQLNDLIMRDEGMHGKQACMEYKERIVNKLPVEYAHKLLREATQGELDFSREVLQVRLPGYNHNVASKYVKNACDELCKMAGLPQMYYINGDDLPAFLDSESFDVKDNFFERRGTNYAAVSKKKASLPVSLTKKSRTTRKNAHAF